jgi:hypothetical protein
MFRYYPEKDLVGLKSYTFPITHSLSERLAAAMNPGVN